MFSFQGTVLWINSRFQSLIIKNWNPASIRENKWWAKVDSNHRPHDYQSCALTSWAIGPLVEMSGIEPLTPCLQGRCSPSWAIPPYQSRWWDSNPRPADYKSAALPIELHRLVFLSACLLSTIDSISKKIKFGKYFFIFSENFYFHSKNTSLIYKTNIF